MSDEDKREAIGAGCTVLICAAIWLVIWVAVRL